MSRMKVVGYARVSTSIQASEGVSIEMQVRKIRAYAELHDIELIDVITDEGVSAATLDRPGLNVALGHLRARRAEGLLVLKACRLSRDVRQLLTLVDELFSGKRPRVLMTVDGVIDTRSAAGRMSLSILTSVNAWEREAIGERTSAAMQHMRALGQFTGGSAGKVRYGFAVGADGASLVEVESEQLVIARARAARAAGASLRAIASSLAEAGCVSRAGAAFVPSAIAAMCA